MWVFQRKLSGDWAQSFTNLLNMFFLHADLTAPASNEAQDHYLLKQASDLGVFWTASVLKVLPRVHNCSASISPSLAFDSERHHIKIYLTVVNCELFPQTSDQLHNVINYERAANEVMEQTRSSWKLKPLPFSSQHCPVEQGLQHLSKLGNSAACISNATIE